MLHPWRCEQCGDDGRGVQLQRPGLVAPGRTRSSSSSPRRRDGRRAAAASLVAREGGSPACDKPALNWPDLALVEGHEPHGGPIPWPFDEGEEGLRARHGLQQARLAPAGKRQRAEARDPDPVGEGKRSAKPLKRRAISSLGNLASSPISNRLRPIRRETTRSANRR